MRFADESLSLSENEFTILRDLIQQRTGIYFEHGKRDLLAGKLSARALECGFQAFIDYYYLLKYGPGSEEEWKHVMDALSVQETYFWREIEQIRALVDIIVPQHFLAHRAEPLQIWSAACATGEEPLTIAMALNEADWFNRAPIEIRASDGSNAALAKARKGVYRERSFRNLPIALREKYFLEVNEGRRMDPAVHERVKWSKANLLSSQEVSGLLPAHIVFCRNVFIYFSGETIVRIVRRFFEGMFKPGYLFVGVSESLLRHTAEFELQEIGGAFVYVA
jgi:chemotaxis protein methyltransferase CheR